jgi:membrane protease YdiL (CAAX protease family)
MIVVFFILIITLIVLAGFVGCWGYAGYLLWNRQPLLPYEPRRQVPWGLVDLALVLLVGILLMVLTRFVLRDFFGPGAGTPNQPFSLGQNMLLILADTVLKLAAMLIATPIIMFRTGTTWRDLGISPREVQRDILIGLATFCMLAPIVFAIQAALVQFQPYKHPLIEMLTNTPDLRLFAMLAFSAVILAPLSEEWAFRVLLQGWLEKLITYTGPIRDIVIGGTQSLPEPVLGGGELPPGEGIVFAEAAEAARPDTTLQPGIQWIDPANPYAPPQGAESLPPFAASVLGDDAVPSPQPPTLWKQWLPIVASSLIFALMHLSHGLAWIPLTVLALGLGFIYQRTHRILPSITVHFCLNALSMAAFWVQMFEFPELKGK